jgi:hypothetical protein
MLNPIDAMTLHLMNIYDSDETLTKPEWAEILQTMPDG